MYPPTRRPTVPYVLILARAMLPRLLRFPPPQSSTWVWTGWVFIDWMRLVHRSSCQMGVDFKEDHATKSLREVADVSTTEDTCHRVRCVLQRRRAQKRNWFSAISNYQLNAQFFYFSTICMLHYAPQHVSSSTLLILRRTNCIRGCGVALTLGNRPGIYFLGGWVAPRAALDGCGKSCPHRDSISGPSSP